MKVFAERLKDLRMESNLTQKQLASKLGVTHASVSRWESDIHEPKQSELVAVAKFFRVSTDYLSGLED